MFCENCGKQIDDDSYFCVHCGSKTTPLTAPVVNAEAPKQATISPFAIVQLVLNLGLAISPFFDAFSVVGLWDCSIVGIQKAVDIFGKVIDDLDIYANIMKAVMVIGWVVLVIALLQLIFSKTAKSFWGSSALSCFAFVVMDAVLYYIVTQIKIGKYISLVSVTTTFYIFAAIGVMGFVLALAMKIRSK